MPSPLHILNFFFLQWFFIRLAKIVDDDGTTLAWVLIKAWPLTGYWGRPYKMWGAKK